MDINKQELDRHITGNYGEDQFSKDELPEGYSYDEPVAWLIVHYGPGKAEKEVVLSPLTDDHYMGEGDEAWPLFFMPEE